MCISAATMMAISAGVSVAGQLSQGLAAKRAGDAQAQRDEILARQQQDQAQAEAQRIRRAGDRAQGAARAQLAASGISVQDGTALLIDEDIGRRVEDDAFQTLLTGDRQAAGHRFAGAQAKARGHNSLLERGVDAAFTGLQGWKGVSSRQADPIGDFYYRGNRGAGD